MNLNRKQILNQSIDHALTRQAIHTVKRSADDEQGIMAATFVASMADVMASTARFLADSGWQAGQAWGAEVIASPSPLTEFGRRRGYYPAAGGREDAILMDMPI